MRKSKKEKNKREYLDFLYRSSVSPERLYCFVRADYLHRCCKYPTINAMEIAKKEWNKLMGKVEERKRYE